VRWLPELLLGTGAAAMVSDLDLDGPDRPRARIGARWLGACAAAQLLLLYAGAGWGLGRLWDEPGAGRLTAVLLAALAIYFVILSTGPQAYSRFRVPISPLLALAAARGLARPSGDGQ
jgi:hypothetical protein